MIENQFSKWVAENPAKVSEFFEDKKNSDVLASMRDFFESDYEMWCMTFDLDVTYFCEQDHEEVEDICTRCHKCSEHCECDKLYYQWQEDGFFIHNGVIVSKEKPPFGDPQSVRFELHYDGSIILVEAWETKRK